MDYPKMLYKYPGKYKLQDGLYDIKTVHDEDEEDDAKKQGYCLTPIEAKNAEDSEEKPKKRGRKPKPVD